MSDNILFRPTSALVCAAVCLLAPVLATAATVSLAPTADNTIYQGIDPETGENFEANSCGAGTGLFTGMTADGFSRRALVRFDIAGSMPPGSTIDSVRLTMDVNRTGDNQDAPMTLHPVGRDWGEGTQNCDAVRGGGKGVSAAAGDATWTDAQFQQVSWTSAGGDFSPASGTAIAPQRGTVTWDSAQAGNTSLVADVQNWLDNPGQNFGWAVLGDETRVPTTRRLSSREGSPAPQLTVEFTPTGDVFACCFGDGDCSITDTTDCVNQGGTPDTGSNTCEPNPCPQPVGACCNLDESCSEPVDRESCESAGGSFQGSGSTCSQGSVDCGLEPFVDALPRPAVLQPVGTRSDGTPQYEITMSQQRQTLHRDLPASDVWTYNGTYPGPTIEAVAGQPIEVKYINSLPTGNQKRGRHLFEVDECAHGPNYWQDTARTVVHLHGGHVPARFDGQPEYHFEPGGFDTYEYANNQLPATLWIHDHALGITRLNVYAGMAAFYLLRDDFEAALGLPAGEYEVPLVVQDREFNPDGSLFYNPTLQDAFRGDRVLVNGKVWPYLDTKQGKYRFRLLNGSQARDYLLRLENRDDPAQVIPFAVIGTDGGLLDGPLSVDTVPLSPGERLDVIVDFSGLPAGARVVLRNDNTDVPRVPNVMQFNVTGEVGFTGAIPSTLRLVDTLDPTGVPTRYFRLLKKDAPCSNDPNRIIGEWLVQSLDGQNGSVIGEHWDDITEYPVLGTREIWEFENPTNTMHPMHVHLVQFQVLDKFDITDPQNPVAIPLEPWEANSWKDTVRVPPRSKVRVIMDFEDYLGKFPYHCHILDHEDHEMMRQFQVTNDPTNCDLDGVCEVGEDCQTCADCGFPADTGADPVSGAFCGNGLCETGDGENFDNCSLDCAGKTKGKDPFKCGNPADGDYVNCTDDARCTDGYFCRESPRVAACCGDMLCEGQETASSCALDCATGGSSLNCAQIQDKGLCNAELACEWQGSPKSGACVESTGGGECTPTQGEETQELSCSDGVDNDCDAAIDCADSDCATDPACQAADCSQFADKASCNVEPTCSWDNRSKSCVAN